MKYVMRILLVLGASAAISGCVIVTDVNADWDWGSDWVERSQDIHMGADMLEFNARGTLYITQGRANELQLEGHDGTLDQLDVEYQDGTVVISQSSDNHRWFEINGKGREPIYTLEIDDLRHVRHGGHGTIRIGPFSSDEITIESYDHARTYVASLNSRDVILEASDHAFVEVETLDSDALALSARDHGNLYVHDANVIDSSVSARSHGEVNIEGAADSLTVRVSDHADVQAEGFRTAFARISAEGHADISANVADELVLDETDNASVEILGTPVLSSN